MRFYNSCWLNFILTNIHKIERRGDLKEAYNRINNYLLKNPIPFESNFYKVVNREIKHWELNQGALTIDDYFRDIGLNFEEICNQLWSPSDDSEYLLYIQFVIELSLFLYSKKRIEVSAIKYFLSWFKPLHRLVRTHLELVNFQITIENDETVIIHKRQVFVDTSIQSITDQKIQMLLLQYLDFRVEKNLEFKISTLITFYKYVEEHKNLSKTRVIIKETESKEINLIQEFKKICNIYNIRHYPSQLENKNTLNNLSDDDLLELCDIAFHLFVEAIRIPEIYSIKERLIELDSKFLLINDGTNS